MFNQYPRCRSRVYPPSSIENVDDRTRAEYIDRCKKLPKASLKLNHVFGSSGSPGSVISINVENQQSNLIAFSASAVVVVVNVSNRIDREEKKSKHSQNIFALHSDEVTCLCTRTNLIASSELGFTPKVMVWNATTFELVGPVVSLMERSVSCQTMAFVNSQLLAAMTNDQNHSIAIIAYKSGTILCNARSGPSLTYGIMVQKKLQFDSIKCKSLISFGKRHLRFWVFDQNENKITSSTKSTSSDVLCGAIVEEYKCVIAGQGNGTITFWIQNIKKAEDNRGEGGEESFELTTRATLISTYGPIGDGSTPVTSLCVCPRLSASPSATASPSSEFTEKNTIIFASGQSDGCLMIHATRLQKSENGSNIIVSKLIKIPTGEWGRSLNVHHRALTSIMFNWNIWSRTKTNVEPKRRKARKISMGEGGRGSVGKSAFMKKSLMKKMQTQNAFMPRPPPATRGDDSSSSKMEIKEPLLVVGTAGGSIFVVSSKEEPSLQINPTSRWSGGIQATCHQHSHGGSVECCEQVDSNHIVSAGRDGMLRIWSINPDKDRRCRAATGLPGMGVCVAVQNLQDDLSNDYAHQRACYVGLADGRVVQVKLHYVSPENQRKMNAKAELARRQSKKKVNVSSSVGSEILPDSFPEWNLCVVNMVNVQNPNGQEMETLQCMSISPDGKVLAVGSRDNNIYLIDITSNEKMQLVKMLTGPSSFLLTIDWSMDGNYIQTNDGSREILYFHIKPKAAKGSSNASSKTSFGAASYVCSRDVSGSKQASSASSMRDVKWDRWTSIFGWPVSGIWAGTSDATDINTTCRGGGEGEEESTLLIAGDDMRNVRLYNWPSLPGAEYVNYQGHHSHVMAVRFCRRLDSTRGLNQWYVISAGGLDKCVFLWSVIEGE
jgi:WD40 repeat protein